MHALSPREGHVASFFQFYSNPTQRAVLPIELSAKIVIPISLARSIKVTEIRELDNIESL